jgi:Cu2+-containing amine oxidase
MEAVSQQVQKVQISLHHPQSKTLSINHNNQWKNLTKKIVLTIKEGFKFIKIQIKSLNKKRKLKS